MARVFAAKIKNMNYMIYNLLSYLINYLIIGYFVSLGFHLMIHFSPVKEKFTTKDVIGVMVFWPLVTYGFIKELIKRHNEHNGRR